MRAHVSIGVVGILGIGGFAATACQHARSTIKGDASFRFVAAPEPPPPPQRKAEVAPQPPKERMQIVAAQPISPQRAPIYPAQVLAQRGGDALVGVELTIGPDGRVTDVGPSLATLSTPGPHAAEFREAVEKAVQEWRFRPAEILHLERVEDRNGDYYRLASRETVEWKFDVQFTFTAAGEVH